MGGEVRAVIDIGTNSVKLLVAEVEGPVVRPLHEGSHQTRLGQGFYETHILQTAAIEQTASAAADFVRLAQRWTPAAIKVIATSAARDAINKDDLLKALRAASGVEVTIISGEQEADWAYRGVTTDPRLAGLNLLVMDVGGGSTEFILGTGGRMIFADSFHLGSVRLLEHSIISDPPQPREKEACARKILEILQTKVAPDLAPRLRRLEGPVQLVATGGTSTILARIELSLRGFDRELIEGTLLSREQLDRETLRLWTTPLGARKQIIGLPPNRADVILPGALIFDQVMRFFDLPTLRVSTRGLRFAAVMDSP
jgi:exopolyphosphatase/guanosine-5'-triphosphate,3'-diphosphate pyrophosphatase